MNATQFADTHLSPYKNKGDEIIPTYCPFCMGGQNKDRGTFALSTVKLTYNCKRGSCNESGAFWQLCEKFGEKADSTIAFESQQHEKTYIEPKTKTTEAKERVSEYLKLRGFSKGTWELCGVKESEGNIAFPYYENDKLVLMKFRKSEKHTGGQKAWRESGGKAVFWLMDYCDTDKPLLICEGEMDALAIREAGFTNVVSVPSGNEDLSCIDNCWDWLEKFKEIIIWPDNDQPGKKMCRNLIKRLGNWRCSVIKVAEKDANELLFKAGKEGVMQAIARAEIVPVVGLIQLADVIPYDRNSVIAVPSSIPMINKKIGGYIMGQVSVWTGTSGGGKSVFLGQEMLSALNHGFRVCVFSGELPKTVFQHWCDQQAAGPQNLKWEHDNLRDEFFYFPEDETRERIHDWYKNKYFLIDSFGSAGEDMLIENFEYAARRHNCKVFLIDNLMTTLFNRGSDDFYHKQGNFLGRLVELSHRLDVHVHVVAHPRKIQGRATKMDISGTSEITNRADNVFCITRMNAEIQAERDAINDDRIRKMEDKLPDADTLIDIFKNRFTGVQDTEVALRFCTSSRRFRMSNDEDGWNVKYGWE